jgi:small-conductance mechanosensitive channel
VPAHLLLLTQAGLDAAAGGLLEPFSNLFTPEGARGLLRASLVIVTGLPLTFVLSRWARRLVGRSYSPQQGMVTGKVVFYAGILIILVSVLQELGFSLTPLLGAAGILGIAIGFAAQTSVSNIISGFFLMAEQPFVVDDVVQVGDATGRVLSIDMLSVKLRTFDNRFVRIPNENLVKTQFVNLTRFAIRRVDINVGVAYKEDVGRVREILLQVAKDHPGALMEPEPQFQFLEYGQSSLEFLFGVWARTDSFFRVRNELREEIKRRFDAEGIEIPFPHRTLYAGSVTEPFPVRILREAPDGDARDGKDQDTV